MSASRPANDNYQRFRHQAVRDLAWSCLSPPLVAAIPDAEIWRNSDPQADLAWLAALDEDPDCLLALLDERHSNRLGLYFENLWRFYWLNHPQARLIAHNFQIQDPMSGKTLGAFDFLVNWQGSHWHMETAVKFYLGRVAGTSEGGTTAEGASYWHDWLGPEAEDRLDLKLKRLSEHQLPLSRDPRALAQLADAGATHLWRPLLHLTGYLFYPLTQPMNPPHLAHPAHLRGHWCHWRDLLDSDHPIFAKKEHSLWLPLTRERWLSPAFCDQETQMMDKAAFMDAGKRQSNTRAFDEQRPQLLASMMPGPQGWWEEERFFVVPDQWPRTERPSRNR